MATEKKSTEEKDDDVDFHVIEEKSEPEEKELEKAEKLEAEKIVDEDDEDDEESAESDGERIGADDEDDEELIAKRARRRDEKRLRRERQKAELEDLRNISTSQAKTIEELIANQRKIEAVSIARDLDAIKNEHNEARMVYDRATQNNDTAVMLEARAIIERSAKAYAELDSRRLQGQRQAAPVSRPSNPDTAIRAREWMAKNTWYKPGGQDADSKIADDIDKILSSTGIDQGSETFWREFESRLKVAVPHRYKASAPAERRQTGSSGPPVSGGRIGREVKGKTLIRLSPERMSILKEKGIDPSSDEAKPLLRAFMQYDKENKINTR